MKKNRFKFYFLGSREGLLNRFILIFLTRCDARPIVRAPVAIVSGSPSQLRWHIDLLRSNAGALITVNWNCEVSANMQCVHIMRSVARAPAMLRGLVSAEFRCLDSA